MAGFGGAPLVSLLVWSSLIRRGGLT